LCSTYNEQDNQVVLFLHCDVGEDCLHHYRNVVFVLLSQLCDALVVRT
jgi:hypothetical protein